MSEDKHTALIEELITLTRGSIRIIETDVAELRADVRVLDERWKNHQEDLQKTLDKQEEQLEKLLDKQEELANKEDVSALKKEISALEKRVNTLEKAHSKYLGAAAVIGAILGFIASLAKGFLGL